MPNPKKRKHKAKSKKPPPQQPQQTLTADNDDEENDKKSIAYLVDAFASLSPSLIKTTLQSTNGDLYKASEILEKQNHPVVDAGSSNGSGSTKRRSRRGVTVAATGTVAGVIGKGYSSEGKGRLMSGKGEMKNRVVDLNEAEGFLCSMLGEESNIGMDAVRDVLGQCGCDIEKALEVLLDMSASSPNQIGGKESCNYENSRQIYSGIRPEISCKDPPKNFTSFFKSTDNASDMVHQPPNGQNKFLGNAEYGFWDPMPDKSEATKPALEQKVLQSLFNIPEFHERDPKTMDWKKVLKKVESLGQGLDFASTSSSDTQSDDSNGKEDIYQVSRSIPKKNWDMMKGYYQKAALAYSRGERSYAAYLSEQGRVHRDLAHVADERASREIFEARNKNIKNIVTIDLHGQHVKQAIKLLKLHLMLFTYSPSVRYLRVITGCGGDGVGKGKLKRSVIGLVEKEGIEWSEENVGTIIFPVDGPKEYSFTECDSDSE